MMSNQNRELTSKEKRSIKKLVTRFCANYDSEQRVRVLAAGL